MQNNYPSHVRKHSGGMDKTHLVYTTKAALPEQEVVVLVVQGSWQSRQDTILHMTLVSGRSLSFFAVVEGVDVTNVDVVEVVVVDVEVVDTESFAENYWYVVEDTEL